MVGAGSHSDSHHDGVSTSFPVQGPPLRWVVFDLETSGLVKPDLLVGIVWDSDSNWVTIYGQSEVTQLAAHLEAADIVVSWNGEKFDRWVVAHNLKHHMTLKHQLDLWRWLSDQRPRFERGWKLEDVSYRLFHSVPKAQPSSEIPGMWEKGQHIAVAKHGCVDVYYTRSIFEHIRDKGWMLDPNGGIMKLEVPEWWQRMFPSPSGAPGVAVTVL